MLFAWIMHSLSEIIVEPIKLSCSLLVLYVTMTDEPLNIFLYFTLQYTVH